MDKLIYEPIVDHLPAVTTVDDLRKLYDRLRPLFTEEEQMEKVIQIREE